MSRMNIRLSDRAKQTEFAELVGITQPAVSKHAKEGLLPRGASYRRWLTAYCKRLREQAAGRGADNSAELTKARIRESNAKAEALELAAAEKSGTLILAEMVTPVFEQVFVNFRERMLEAGSRAASHIEARYGHELDDSDLAAHLRLGLQRCADTVEDMSIAIEQAASRG